MNNNKCQSSNGIKMLLDKFFHENPEEFMRQYVNETFVDKKNQSTVLSEAYSRLGYEKKSIRVFDCGGFLGFNADRQLIQANFCRDRLCPMCNWRKSLKYFAQLSKVMDYLQLHPDVYGEYEFLFLTLTIRNCHGLDLPGVIDAMQKGYFNFIHQYKPIVRAFKGTFRSFEITRNREDPFLEWHPHYHVIVAVPKGYASTDSKIYLTTEQLSEYWGKAVGLNYDPIVFIEKIKPKWDFENSRFDFGKSIAETAKYAVKGSDYLSDQDDSSEIDSSVDTLLTALHDRRLTSFTGVLRKVRQDLKLEDVEKSQLLDIDDLNAEDLRDDLKQVVFHYRWNFGVYIRFDPT